MKRLSLDTYGEHFQLAGETQKPTPIEELIEQGMATLYANLTGQRTQYRLTYTSQIAAPGVHGIGIAVGTRSARTSLSLNIRPPQVSLDQPSAGQLITRQTDDPAMSLQDIEPRTQTVGFQVSFPDGYQRDVAAVELLVDGVAVLDTCSPPCTEITWNLAALPAGAHSLRLRVRDQQGLEAVSNEVPVTISIITPTPIPTPVPTPIVLPTPIPPPLSCEEQYSGVNRVLHCNQQIFGLGALLVSVGALLLAFVVIRRPPQVVSTVARRVKDATIPFRPIQVQPGAQPALKATLEVLEGDESHSKPIDLIAESTRMGRDEELVQVVFQNRSVSRLHARIAVETDRKGDARYVLYDEGSTSGTYVNMQSVGIKGQELNDGDTIHLGPVRLRFTLKGKKPVVARDDTIPSIPIPPKTAAPVEDEFATSPYAPAQPGPAPAPAIDATQPFTAAGSAATPEGPDVYMEEEEEISTEPYVPMDFSDE
jgi:pSer/pThr/pTyr-binding forkhead associated (FHA) protein